MFQKVLRLVRENSFIVALIFVGILITGAIVYVNYNQCLENKKTPTSNVISSQEAAEKLINFVNKNLLNGQITASLIESVEDGDFYNVKFKVQEEEVNWKITKNGRFIFPNTIDLSQVKEPAKETGKGAGNFSISSDEICKEENKPIVYFFGMKSCPHCNWEHPIIEEVVAKFGNNISFHNNMDSENDMEIFSRYSSSGGVPTLVLGCKYYRVGSGENLGKDEEKKVLTNLICELTNNQPVEVCQK